MPIADNDDGSQLQRIGDFIVENYFWIIFWGFFVSMMFNGSMFALAMEIS